MVSIPLRIFIQGLIALVPTMDPSGAKMTALLVDGRHADPASCMYEHHPKLKIHVAQDSDCTKAGCVALGGGDCLCQYDNQTKNDPLVGKDIWLEISPSPSLATGNPSNSLPGHALPDDSREAGSFSYVANLSQEPFGLKIDQKYLLANPPQEARANMVTRMVAPYKTVTACALATRDDGGQANVHTMSFREFQAPSNSGDVSYALAQMVVTELGVPDGGSVALHISDFGGTNDHRLVLASERLDPSSQFILYKIRLSNELQAPLDYDDPCNYGVARHFEHFYQLAESTTAHPLLPHVRFTQFKSAVPLEPKVCKDRTFELSDRPICPMASFNP
jgi:hypothetical protein